MLGYSGAKGVITKAVFSREVKQVLILRQLYRGSDVWTRTALSGRHRALKNDILRCLGLRFIILTEIQGAPKGRQQKGETGPRTHIFADFR